MIEAKLLTRHYGHQVAVDQVSFSISDHEIVGLLGPNGAGKSTIMKMLSGYLEPSSGAIFVDGQALEDHPHTLPDKLGYLPENLPIYREMMVADYLDYAATLRGIAAKERMRSIREVVTATQLGDKALASISTLSRGQKQRLGIAQALLGRPRLLIMDEPTNGLDPEQTEQMRSLIKQLARRATIIMSTHIMQEVEAVCDRVLVLSEGQLVLDEKLAQLRQTQSLLLCTNSSSDNLGKLLQKLPQVRNVTLLGDKDTQQRYELELHETADINTATGNISQCVVQSGNKLYQLQPIVRDLEGVFHDAIAKRTGDT